MSTLVFINTNIFTTQEDTSMKEVIDAIISELNNYAKKLQIIHGNITNDLQENPHTQPIDLDDNYTSIGHANSTAWVNTYIQQEKRQYETLANYGVNVPGEILTSFATIDNRRYSNIPAQERRLFAHFISEQRGNYFSALETQRTRETFQQSANPFLSLSRTAPVQNGEFQQTLSYWQDQVNSRNNNIGQARL